MRPYWIFSYYYLSISSIEHRKKKMVQSQLVTWDLIDKRVKTTNEQGLQMYKRNSCNIVCRINVLFCTIFPEDVGIQYRKKNMREITWSQNIFQHRLYQRWRERVSINIMFWLNPESMLYFCHSILLIFVLPSVLQQWKSVQLIIQCCLKRARPF